MNEATLQTQAERTQKTLSLVELLLVITGFLLVILIVITIVLEIQVQSRNEDIARVKVATTELKDYANRAAIASEASEKALNDAIEQSKATSGANSQFAHDIRDGLANIKENKQTLAEIKAFLNQLKGQ